MSGIVDFNTILHTEDTEFVNDDNPLPVSGGAGGLLTRRLAQLLKPLSVVTGGGSNRLSIDVNSLPTLGTVNTVNTVNNVTSVNQLGGIATFQMLRDTNRAAYNTGIRANITP